MDVWIFLWAHFLQPFKDFGETDVDVFLALAESQGQFSLTKPSQYIILSPRQVAPTCSLVELPPSYVFTPFLVKSHTSWFSDAHPQKNVSVSAQMDCLHCSAEMWPLGGILFLLCRFCSRTDGVPLLTIGPQCLLPLYRQSPPLWHGCRGNAGSCCSDNWLFMILSNEISHLYVRDALTMAFREGGLSRRG